MIFLKQKDWNSIFLSNKIIKFIFIKLTYYCYDFFLTDVISFYVIW